MDEREIHDCERALGSKHLSLGAQEGVTPCLVAFATQSKRFFFSRNFFYENAHFSFSLLRRNVMQGQRAENKEANSSTPSHPIPRKRKPGWTSLSRDRGKKLWKPLKENLEDLTHVQLGRYEAQSFRATDQESLISDFLESGWLGDSKRLLTTTQSLIEKKRAPRKTSNSFKKLLKRVMPVVQEKRLKSKRKRESEEEDEKDSVMLDHKSCLDLTIDELDDKINQIHVERHAEYLEKERLETEEEACSIVKKVRRKTRCVRMYPDVAQRKVLDGWFTDTQKVWNQALNMIYRAEFHLIRKDIEFVPKTRSSAKKQKLDKKQELENPKPRMVILNDKKPHRKRRRHQMKRLRTIQSQLDAKRSERFRVLREEKSVKWKAERERISQDWKVNVTYSSALQQSETWEHLRKHFTTADALLRNQKPSLRQVKTGHKAFFPPPFQPGTRTPVDLAQNSLKMLRETWKSGITKLIRKQHFYFRVKPKRNHFQTSKCSSDVIALSSRSTQLFAHGDAHVEASENSFELRPPLQCKEYKSYAKRFGDTSVGASQRKFSWQTFCGFCEWKKKKLFRRYHLQDTKSHEMITHVLPYKTYMKTPIAVHPFPNNGMQFENDYKILKRDNQFYLLVTQNHFPKEKESEEKESKEKESKDSKEKQKCIAIDPGVNTFLTGYSPEGTLIQVGGQRLKEDLVRILHRQDRVKRHERGVKKHELLDARFIKRTRKKQCMKWRKLERLKQNRIRDFHWKTARFLLSKWETILYPTFNTKNMVKRINNETGAKRRISRQTTRLLGTMSHYKMKQCLAQKESEFPGSSTRICTEEFTSQTCAQCFYITGRMPYSKTFTCPECGFIAPRDSISACLIYNLAATKNPPERSVPDF